VITVAVNQQMIKR